MSIDTDTLNYSSQEAANRAAQALYGLYSLVLLPVEDADTLNEVAKLIIETLRLTETQSEEENIDCYIKLRELFRKNYSKLNLSFFIDDEDKIWKLFLERYYFATGQMRMSVRDLHQCCNYDELALSMSRSKVYLQRLPPSSEIVLIPMLGMIKVDIVIPPRLLVLDMLLMLVHAKSEHDILQRLWLQNKESGYTGLHVNGRLDAYSRQVIIIATTICDNVLTEYGYIVEAIAKKNQQEDVAEELKGLHKAGVTRRLQQVPNKWPNIVGSNKFKENEVFEDMIGLITMRNRLVHPDGGINGWFASQVSPLYGNGWSFSDRLNHYIKKFEHDFSEYNFGFEYATCLFCVDTTIAVIHALHRLVFVGDSHAYWLDMPTIDDSKIDLEFIVSQEEILQIE